MFEGASVTSEVEASHQSRTYSTAGLIRVTAALVRAARGDSVIVGVKVGAAEALAGVLRTKVREALGLAPVHAGLNGH